MSQKCKKTTLKNGKTVSSAGRKYLFPGGKNKSKRGCGTVGPWGCRAVGLRGSGAVGLRGCGAVGLQGCGASTQPRPQSRPCPNTASGPNPAPAAAGPRPGKGVGQRHPVGEAAAGPGEPPSLSHEPGTRTPAGTSPRLQWRTTSPTRPEGLWLFCLQELLELVFE